MLPLDSDDWLEPTALEVMMKVLKSSYYASFVFCDLQLEGEASEVLKRNIIFSSSFPLTSYRTAC